MKEHFHFTFSHIREYFEKALTNNYQIITCRDYSAYKEELSYKTRLLINRVDIDLSPKKAKRLAMMFNDLGIKATFFVRLHANEYNPFAFENYRILKYIRDSGHEIGYHSEVIEESVIWNEPADECLQRDIHILNSMLGINIQGVASHGGLTELNNLDFWKERRPADFGLLYEAYDRHPEFNLFYDAIYVSDANWTTWKCYNQGTLIDGDTRTLGEHIEAGHDLIYTLIHPATYFDQHFYE